MLVSIVVAGLCAQTSDSDRSLYIWRSVKAGLLDSALYFNKIEGAETPPDESLFDGTVVSKPSASKLIVNVDDPVGDAILICQHVPEGVEPGTRVHFKGAIESYTRQPYRLTLRFAQVTDERISPAALVNSEPAPRTRRPIRPDQFFAYPRALCKALEPEGIRPGQWAPIGRAAPSANAPFECEYSGVPEADPPPKDWHHTTVFRVSGDYAQRADIISLAVGVGNQSDWPQAQEEFLRLVSPLFGAIGKPEPAGLKRAINARRYYLRRLPYGVVWFDFVAPMEPSRRRTFWLRVSE